MPAKTLNRRLACAVKIELNLKFFKSETVSGTWLTKASVNRWGTL